MSTSLSWPKSTLSPAHEVNQSNLYSRVPSVHFTMSTCLTCTKTVPERLSIHFWPFFDITMQITHTSRHLSAPSLRSQCENCWDVSLNTILALSRPVRVKNSEFLCMLTSAIYKITHFKVFAESPTVQSRKESLNLASECNHNDSRPIRVKKSEFLHILTSSICKITHFQVFADSATYADSKKTIEFSIWMQS